MRNKIMIGLMVFTTLLAYCSNPNNTEEKLQNIEFGKTLISKSDCNSCHNLETKIIGPSYLEIAQKYENNSTNIQKLAQKIINGGSGAWGDIPMIAHSELEDNDAQAMVQYIFSLADSEVD